MPSTLYPNLLLDPMSAPSSSSTSSSTRRPRPAADGGIASRRKPSGPATLSPLLRHLCGLMVTVELKSGRLYRGVLDETDNFMNVVIKRRDDEANGGRNMPPSLADTEGVADNTQENNNHNEDDDDGDLPFDRVHIRGPLIRYIHLPPRADLARLIKDGIDRERRARDKYKRNVIRKKSGQR